MNDAMKRLQSGNMITALCLLSKYKPFYILVMLCECKISIKCYDEEIEVAGQVAGQPAAHAKIKPEMDASIIAYSAS